MINLLNKILSRFHFKLVSTKPVDLVKETVKFLNTLSPEDLSNDKFFPPYVGGDITFVNDSKTYFRQVVGTEHKYFDYDGNTYTPEELQAFLIKKRRQFKND
jgi:hypothetical protein